MCHKNNLEVQSFITTSRFLAAEGTWKGSTENRGWTKSIHQHLSGETGKQKKETNIRVGEFDKPEAQVSINANLPLNKHRSCRSEFVSSHIYTPQCHTHSTK